MKSKTPNHKGRGLREMKRAAHFFASISMQVKGCMGSIPYAAAWPWPAVLVLLADVLREVRV